MSGPGVMQRIMMSAVKKSSPVEIKIVQKASAAKYIPPPDVAVVSPDQVAESFKTWTPMLKCLTQAPALIREDFKGINGKKIPWSTEQGVVKQQKISLKSHVMSLPAWVRKSEFSNVDLSQHVQELIKAFKIYDTNNKGFITKEDLKAAMINSGEKFTDEEVDKMMSQADTVGDDKINFQEFVQMIAN